MCFGETYLKLKDFRHGCILLIMSPKLMNKSEQGTSFSIETEAQFQIIGYSEDYSICKGKT
jgi:hypothetical protein